MAFASLSRCKHTRTLALQHSSMHAHTQKRALLALTQPPEPTEEPLEQPADNLEWKDNADNRAADGAARLDGAGGQSRSTEDAELHCNGYTATAGIHVCRAQHAVLAWHDTAPHRKEQHGTAQHSMRHWNGTAWHGAAQHGSPWQGQEQWW